MSFLEFHSISEDVRQSDVEIVQSQRAFGLKSRQEGQKRSRLRAMKRRGEERGAESSAVIPAGKWPWKGRGAQAKNDCQERRVHGNAK